MAKQKSPPVEGIPADITDLINVLCGYRKEAYPFEKYVALLTFSMWMIWPLKPEIVAHAKIVAAALLIHAMANNKFSLAKDERSKCIETVAEFAMPPAAAAEVLLKRIVWSFRDEMIGAANSIDDVTGIVLFFLLCPPEMKPSFNKAMFFLDAGGYADSDDSIEDKKATRVSPSTLKNSWGRLAVSSPFLFAADYLNIQSIYDLAPDEIDSISEATKLLKNVDRLKDFFEVARYAQKTMIISLDKRTKDRFTFVDFPDSLEEFATFNAEPFGQRELDIIKTYKAPKFTANYSEHNEKAK